MLTCELNIPAYFYVINKNLYIKNLQFKNLIKIIQLKKKVIRCSLEKFHIIKIKVTNYFELLLLRNEYKCLHDSVMYIKIKVSTTFDIIFLRISPGGVIKR